MQSKFLTGALLLMFSNEPLALEENNITKLYISSDNIENSVNNESVVESLYQQIRPRSIITNLALSQQEVDIKVKEYVSIKYMPSLLMNYRHIYSQLRANNGELHSCENAKPIQIDSDILKKLCLKGDDSHVQVIYMNNAYLQGWKTSATYVFSMVKEKYELTSIDLHLKEGVNAYVEGI